MYATTTLLCQLQPCCAQLQPCCTQLQPCCRQLQPCCTQLQRYFFFSACVREASAAVVENYGAAVAATAAAATSAAAIKTAGIYDAAIN